MLHLFDYQFPTARTAVSLRRRNFDRGRVFGTTSGGGGSYIGTVFESRRSRMLQLRPTPVKNSLSKGLRKPPSSAWGSLRSSLIPIPVNGNYPLTPRRIWHSVA